jgi:hypothetical protein
MEEGSESGPAPSDIQSKSEDIPAVNSESTPMEVSSGPSPFSLLDTKIIRLINKASNVGIITQPDINAGITLADLSKLLDTYHQREIIPDDEKSKCIGYINDMIEFKHNHLPKDVKYYRQTNFNWRLKTYLYYNIYEANFLKALNSISAEKYNSETELHSLIQLLPLANFKEYRRHILIYLRYVGNNFTISQFTKFREIITNMNQVISALKNYNILRPLSYIGGLKTSDLISLMNHMPKTNKKFGQKTSKYKATIAQYLEFIHSPDSQLKNILFINYYDKSESSNVKNGKEEV